MTRPVLLDLSGVLYVGGAALPGAVAAVERLRGAGCKVRFLTNSTKSPRRKILKKLDDFGFSLEPDELFTPVRMARDILAADGMQAHLLIHPDLEEDFEDMPEGNGKTAVVIGDAAEYFTYDAMNRAYRALEDGAELLALAANRVFTDEDGRRSIDVGAYVAALEYASGTRARVLGKPSEAYFRAALASMGARADEAVMVGDDAEADVAGARNAGLGAAVLVRTGKYRPGDEGAHEPPPSHLADDLSAAVEWILTR